MNLGNLFDSIFKKPWLDTVHAVEHSPETVALITTAEADIGAARTALATAVASHEAAAQATVKGFIDPAIDAIAERVPVIGGLIRGEADAAANATTDNVIHALIGRLEGFLSPDFNKPPL